MKAAFLFMDECFSDALNLAALTGVLVPLDSYALVRDEVSAIAWSCLRAPPNTIPRPVELHGSNMLRDIGEYAPEDLDGARLAVFERAAALVNSQRLRICRVAYTNRSEIANVLAGDPALYGLTFFGIQSWLGHIMAETLVIPVMDGVPDSSRTAKAPSINPQLIRAFASHVRLIHHYRSASLAEENLSIANPVNLAEPLFGDSTYSTLLQLVDLVSYLLHQVEKADAGKPSKGPFSKALVRIARSLDASLIYSWCGLLRLHPSTPPEIASPAV